MREIDIGNGFVVREVPASEYHGYLKNHFGSVFNNRADDFQNVQLSEEAEQKISKRSKADRFQLRLIVFKNQEVVGWHHGYEKEPDTYYMQNSAVLEPYRNLGIYSKLLDVALGYIQEEGFQVAISTHHPHNAAVLIPKIKKGFFISGMFINERFRTLVEMKFIFDEQRRKNHFKNLGLEL